MHLEIVLIVSFISQVLSIPVSPAINPQCTAPCEWTQWFNVDHPSDTVDGGDWETLENIRAHGYSVCRVPRDVRCRSVYFPYVPYDQLLYNARCERTLGLICLNKDNEAKCADFEVQLLCCPCDHVPDSPPQPVTTVSTTPSTCTDSCQWTQWFNVDQPTNDINDGDWETLENIRAHNYDICQAPRGINCRSARFPYIPYKELLYNTQCDASRGLICLNKGNVDTCIDYEVQFLCCTCDDKINTTLPQMTVTSAVTTETTGAPCEDQQCSWTNWFNMHHPTAGLDGGDYENITAIRQRGYSICDYPQAISCRMERFPYIPLKELISVQQCSIDNGLVCLNKDQQDTQCPDYEVQFLCCTCNATSSQALDSPNILHQGPTSADVDYTDQGSSMFENEE